MELNPVRAGLVERPEDWTGSSIFLREKGKGDWYALADILKTRKPELDGIIEAEKGPVEQPRVRKAFLLLWDHIAA